MSSLRTRLTSRAEYLDPNVVKVVVDRHDVALYFSRAPIPHARDAAPQRRTARVGLAPHRHVRLSAYVSGHLHQPAADPARTRRAARTTPRTRTRLPHHRARDRAPVRRRGHAIGSGRSRSHGRAQPLEAVTRDTRYDDERDDETDEIHLRNWRRGVVARQGAGRRLDRQPARRARLSGHPAEVRPLHQRGSGHDEPVSARRGVRYRRRRRDRPRPRALRAVHQHGAHPEQQLDDRQDLPVGHPEGTARRLPRRHRAGHPAHHQRDQGQHPRRLARRGHRHRRDRRDGRRHREPALPRGHSPVPPGCRARQHYLYPSHARAVHRHGGRGEDQAHAAQRARPALDRHPARHPALPHGSAPARAT